MNGREGGGNGGRAASEGAAATVGPRVMKT